MRRDHYGFLPPDREHVRKIHVDAFGAVKQLNCGEV
jgi:hypothetical protein